MILDYNPSYFDEKELSKALALQPECKVIILSSQDKKWQVFKSLKFNVYSYLTKECSELDVIKSIRMASKGEKFFCSFIVEMLLGEKDEWQNESAHIPSCLTERETEITKLVAQGLMNKEIADELSLSPHTIHSHRKNIMKKLNIHSAVELTNYAKEAGIVD